jgi:type I restriction enzyme S subunit
MYKIKTYFDSVDYSGPIYEIADWLNGTSFNYNEIGKKGTPIIKIKELKLGLNNETEYYSGNEKNKFKLENGDLLYSWSGSPETSLDSFYFRLDEGILNQHIFKISPKKFILKDYIYYLLIYIKPILVRIAKDKQTTGLGHITLQDLKDLKIDIPSKYIQTGIVETLNPLFNKIEINKKIIKNIEELLFSIFKLFFIKFDYLELKIKNGTSPTNHILNLFPDNFIESKKGRIPYGWQLSSFEYLAKPIRGKTITQNMIEEGNVPVVAGGLEPAYFHNKSNVNGPVVTVSASGASAGFVKLYQENIWASDCSYISKEKTKFFYSSYIFLKIFQKKIFYSQTGAAQPHINPKDLMRLDFVNPGEEILSKFEKIVEPFFDKIKILDDEIKILKKIKDMLVPKLISGQHKVSKDFKLKSNE